MSDLTIAQALLWAKTQLAQNIEIEDAMFEAQILLAHSMMQSRAYLMTWPDKIINEDQLKQFTSVIQRRLQNEPIAYIVGKREFWSLELEVNTDTLIPRPETELLVETALRILPPNAKVADLGTGSGAIALALASERPEWQVTATDIKLATLQVAKANAARLHLSNVHFLQGIWCDALVEKDYDAIISNPPYIAQSEWAAYASGLAFEPRDALVSGDDGLQDIRIISKQALHYLRSAGFLLLEHGFSQGEAVRAILISDGYTNVHSICDLAMLERMTIGMLP